MRFVHISRVHVLVITLLVCCALSSCNTSPNNPPSLATCASWQIVPSPNPGNIGDELADIFTVSSDNIWVAGTVTDTSTSRDNRTLVEHWNGKSWTVVPSQNPSPEPDGYPDSLDRINGSSANDIWAVGDGYGGFLEHWNGSAWSVVDTPVVPQTVYSYTFSSVSSLSPTDAWVVGHAMSRAPSIGNGDLALTAHWDGKAWSVVPSPDLHADLNGTELDDVLALAHDNVWAVGSTSSCSQSQLTLIEHWDGKSWRVVSNPQPQGTAIGSAAALWSLAALAPNNIWAGGFYTASGVDHYLVEHWDGHAWSLVSIPTPAKKLAFLRQIVAVSAHDVWALDDNNSLLHWNGSSWNISSFPNADQNGYSIRSIAALPNGQLWLAGTVRDPTGPGPRTLIAKSGSFDVTINSIAAVSDSDVWVVGIAYTTPSTVIPVAARWDGHTWHVLSSISSPGFTQLNGVTALADDNVWAVGSFFAGGFTQTLVMHWDGSTWKHIPSPNVADENNQFTSISALSANDIWAVGTSNGYEGSLLTLTEHWDGSRWSIVSSPDPSRSRNALSSVAAASSNDVWAVGALEPAQPSTPLTTAGGYKQAFDRVIIETDGLIEHWDGQSWRVASFPRLGQHQILSSITAYSSQDVWAAGTYVVDTDQGQVLHGLIEHWDGSAWHSEEDSRAQFITGIATSAAGGLWDVGFTVPPRNSTGSEQAVAEACM